MKRKRKKPSPLLQAIEAETAEIVAREIEQGQRYVLSDVGNPDEFTLASIAGMAFEHLQTTTERMGKARERLEDFRTETKRVLNLLDKQLELYDRILQAARARFKEER